MIIFDQPFDPDDRATIEAAVDLIDRRLRKFTGLSAGESFAAVFAGYSADSKSRAAHEICWKNAMEIKK